MGFIHLSHRRFSGGTISGYCAMFDAVYDIYCFTVARIAFLQEIDQGGTEGMEWGTGYQKYYKRKNQEWTGGDRRRQGGQIEKKGNREKINKIYNKRNPGDRSHTRGVRK